MSAWAKPGVKCVCISRWGGHKAWYLPRLATVYTVDSVDVCHQYGPMLGLAEISAPDTSYKFPVGCFRPLAFKPQSLEHDVQRFKDIARHAPVLDSEDA